MKPTPETRFSLIEKIKRPGDADAWAEFTTIYHPLIVDICRSKGLQHADASDVAQEVMTRVAKSIANFEYDKSGSTFRGWLYCITRNLTIDFFRKREKDPLNNAVDPTNFHSMRQPNAEESYIFQLGFQKRMFMLVAESVESQVKPQTWAAFWKVEVERRDPAEVASEIGLTRGAVYVAKSRVIARLRKEVEKRLQETSPFFHPETH